MPLPIVHPEDVSSWRPPMFHVYAFLQQAGEKAITVHRHGAFTSIEEAKADVERAEREMETGPLVQLIGRASGRVAYRCFAAKNMGWVPVATWTFIRGQ